MFFSALTSNCAQLYSHISFGPPRIIIPETPGLDLSPSFNDQASSAIVTPGCILSLYQDFQEVNLLDTLTADTVFFDAYNDEVSSVTCTCQGKF